MKLKELLPLKVILQDLGLCCVLVEHNMSCVLTINLDMQRERDCHRL